MGIFCEMCHVMLIVCDMHSSFNNYVCRVWQCLLCIYVYMSPCFYMCVYMCPCVTIYVHVYSCVFMCHVWHMLLHFICVFMLLWLLSVHVCLYIYFPCMCITSVSPIISTIDASLMLSSIINMPSIFVCVCDFIYMSRDADGSYTLHGFEHILSYKCIGLASFKIHTVVWLGDFPEF